MRILNKKARFNYTLGERFEAGISLSGIEAKTLRSGRGDLTNSFAKFIGNELFLVNAIVPVSGVNRESNRTRKLLMHKSELISIKSKIKAKKLTIVPVKIYTKGRLVKVELALSKSKRNFEKKEAIKKKDIEREIAQELRGKDLI